MGCRIAAGEVYMRNLGVADQPLLPVGNAQLQANITETVEELPDYTSDAGGNACSSRAIEAVELVGTLYDFKPENLALAVFGEQEAVASAAVADEAIDAFADGALNLLAHMPTPGTVVVTDPAGPTVYTEDTDYTVTKGGFIVIAGSALATAIAGGTGTPKHLAVEVDYTKLAHDVVAGLTTSGKLVQVVVVARNRADSGKGEVWNFYTVQLGPISGLNIISREFGSFELKGECIADTSQPEGETQYFTIKQQQ